MLTKLSLINETQTANNLLWDLNVNNPYEESNIQNIVDNMGEIEIPITSIPSPFAQMHLFDNAFKYVVSKIRQIENSESRISILDGSTKYHRLISHCLDVWEWMYDIEHFGLNQFSLTTWDLNNEAELLRHSGLRGLDTLTNSFELFINSYNQGERFIEIQLAFNRFQLMLVNNTVVAASSPLTGFFTTPNLIRTELRRRDSSLLFNDILPFYKRDIDFIRFMLTFLHSNVKISNAFQNLYEYCKIRTGDIDNEINTIESRSPDDNFGVLRNNFEILRFNNVAFEILPSIVLIKKRREDIRQIIATGSDFRIKTTKRSITNPPLALIDGCNMPHYKYINGPLPKNFVLDPALLGPEIENRFLPNSQQINYPFVSIDDVLTKNLIKLDYEINDTKYWTPKVNSGFSYLLPVSATFFKYFSMEDLKSNFSMTINPASDSIEVKLKIPLEGDSGKGYLEFYRTYAERSEDYSDEDVSRGNIKHANIFFGIYPFFEVDNNLYNDFYKFFIYHDAEIVTNARVEPYKIKDGNAIQIIPTSDFLRTRKEDKQSYVTHYFEVNKDLNIDITFDFIKICLELQNGRLIENIIIPQMELIELDRNNVPSKLAFDFGTSNTYIAYLKGLDASKIQSFSTLNENRQELVMLNKPIDDPNYDLDIPSATGLLPAQLNELMPVRIADNWKNAFPIKTLVNLSNHAYPNQEDNLKIFSNINIPFAVSSVPLRKDIDTLYSNLKWGIADPEREDLRHIVQSFIEELALLGRNLILSNSLNPSDTKVIWFKPLSMTNRQEEVLSELWNDSYEKYFRKNQNTIGSINCITESWAPIYAQDLNFGGGEVYLNLDIGGGSTDLVSINEDQDIILTSSFRFAGNVLYENGIFNAQLRNGFVDKYIDIMKGYFQTNNMPFEIGILDYMINNPLLKTEDIIGFFFSFEFFRKQLKLDSKFKFLLLLHITSIFYHVAQILKINNCKMPLYIGLSGNGAKLLEILNGTNDLNRINGVATVASKLFSKVYGIQQNIQLLIKDNPKESTCKGGIKGLDLIVNKGDQDIRKYVIAMGDDKSCYYYHNNDKQQDINEYFKLKGENLNQIVEKVASNYKHFIEYFFGDLWGECQLKSSFGLEFITNKQTLHEYMSKEENISGVLYRILKDKKAENLDETLFFYPIRAYLYDLSLKLYGNGSK